MFIFHDSPIIISTKYFSQNVLSTKFFSKLLIQLHGMFTNWILHNIDFHIFGFNFEYFFAISVYSLNFTNIISYIVFHINYFIKIIFYSKAFQLKYSTPLRRSWNHLIPICWFKKLSNISFVLRPLGVDRARFFGLCSSSAWLCII